MAITGISNFHYAPLTADTLAGVTYGAPVKVPGLVSIDLKPSSESAVLYADNGAYDTDTATGECTVAIELADLDLATQAALLGHTVTKGVMSCKAGDEAPFVAISFESLKSNHKKRYMKLLKGRFQEPGSTSKTKGNKVDFQTGKIEGKFLMRVYDQEWQRVADEDATGYEPATGTGWHAAIEPAV